jgi:hypothetical protein
MCAVRINPVMQQRLIAKLPAAPSAANILFRIMRYFQ